MARSRPFSWPLVLGIAAPMMLALFVCGSAVIWRAHAAANADAFERFRQAVRVALGLAGPTWPELGPATRDAIQAAFQVVDVAAVLTVDGRVLFATEPPPISPSQAQASPLAQRARIVGWAEESTPVGYWLPQRNWIAARLGGPDGSGGVLIASRPRITLLHVLGGVWPVLVLGVALVAASTFAVRLLISAHWARELLHITHAVRHVSAGVIAPEAGRAATPELGLLSRAIGQMRSRLMAQVETTDQQRRTFESLLNQLREGVIAVAPDGEVVLINPAAVRLLDLAGAREPAEYVGLAFERVIPHLDLQKLVQRWIEGADPRRRRELKRSFQEVRFQVETQNGVTSLLAQISDLLLPTLIDGQPGNALGGVLVITDISTLVRTIQIKADFVANASHELRTPLSTIRAAIEALKGLGPDDPPGAGQRFVEMLDRQSRRLEELTNDLLDLARLESQAQHFPVESIGLHEFLAELQAHFADRIAEKHVAFDLECDAPDGETLETSRQLLRMILDNLLDNAIKFTTAGRHVRLAVRSTLTHVELEVADEGCGIAAEDQQRVFERFYQVERARAGGPRRGTGLGLSIVRHAVRTLNGEIELASALNVGTTVTVRLPRAPEPARTRMVAGLGQL